MVRNSEFFVKNVVKNPLRPLVFRLFTRFEASIERFEPSTGAFFRRPCIVLGQMPSPTLADWMLEVKNPRASPLQINFQHPVHQVST